MTVIVRIFLWIFMGLLCGFTFAQSEIYSPSPEHIKNHNIKRIIEIRNAPYHAEKGVIPDTSRIRVYNRDGFETYSIGFVDNKRSVWTTTTLDEQNRVLKTERFDGDSLLDVAEYNYLPNGDYITKFYKTNTPKQAQYYKYEFDLDGNERCREYWREDSVVVNWDEKTYNDRHKLLSDVHQVRNEDTMAYTLYYYKDDTLLVKKEFYNKSELSIRTKYKYFPDGKERVVHYGDESSWYKHYNDENKLVKQVIVRHAQKDTLVNSYDYNEFGLISVIRNERDNYTERQELFTYAEGREDTKTVYIRGDRLNAFYETMYLGDTARIIYQTPYWKDKAFYATYERIDAYGNVLEERKAQVKGTKQPINRWMNDAESITQYKYDLNESGKVLAKYQRFRAWAAEESLCRDYNDDRIFAGLDRRNQRRKHTSCDTIRTRRHNGGRHYFVSLSAAPDLTRHVYQNKSGEIDSILDIHTSGAILNRMIKESGSRVSYTLLNRYEYTDFDSVQSVYQCFTTRNYATFENRVEEHFWNGKQKVKERKFYNHWKQFDSQDTTLVTYQYEDGFVFRTTKDRQGKVTEHRLKYDEHSRLVQVMELNRKSNMNRRTDFTYDADGNLLERLITVVATPIETLVRYEFY